MTRDNIFRTVDLYMAALISGDFSGVTFSSKVRFMGPLMDSPVEGIAEVVELLVDVSKGVEDIRIQKRVIEDTTACVLVEFQTTKGEVLPILDYIEIDEEGISYIRPFFDPRPLIEQ